MTTDAADLSWQHTPDLGGTTVVQTPSIPAATTATITLRWDDPDPASH